MTKYIKKKKKKKEIQQSVIWPIVILKARYCVGIIM